MNTTAIAIIAIICWAIVSIVRSGKDYGKTNKLFDKKSEQMQNEIDALKDRVATLEAIVTDEKYNLKREFENLKKNDAA